MENPTARRRELGEDLVQVVAMHFHARVAPLPVTHELAAGATRGRRAAAIITLRVGAAVGLNTN